MNDLEQVESSQRQHFDALQHNEKMHLLIKQDEYNLFVMIKPKLYMDGDQWCCLYGDNLQTGIAGYGDTPYLAILDWNEGWHKTILKPSNK